MTARVLVTDGLWRKSLSAVRALGRAGVEVTVAGDRRLTTAYFSRYCERRLSLPDAALDPDAFYAGLLAELQRRPYDTLFAMEDASLAVVSEHREELGRHTSLPLPPAESLAIARDKARTLALASELGIAAPVTWEQPEAARFPAVVKPARGSGSRGLRYVDTPAELAAAVRELGPEHGRLLVQERLPAGGQGLGAALLFDRASEPVAGFTYQRLREYPVSGGPSTLRESTHDPELLDTATRLLRALGWVGVAMVEFKRDPRDGQAKLLEVNPRFWGSLELAVASGVDFPRLLLKVAQSEPFEPVFDYPAGIRCRWLVPGDLLHFLANPRRFHLQPSFFEFRAPGLHYDDFAADDLRGSLGVLAATAAGAFSPRLWRIAIRR